MSGYWSRVFKRAAELAKKEGADSAFRLARHEVDCEVISEKKQQDLRGICYVCGGYHGDNGLPCPKLKIT